MSRITISNIEEELKPYKWKIISTAYKNLNEELEFECDEGHRVYTSWGKLRKKIECPTCKLNKYKNQETKVIPKSKKFRRTLAFDQSTRVTGWAVFDGDVLVKYGVYETTLSDEIARDSQINNWVVNMIQNWQPDMVGIEGIQYQQQMGVTTFEKLARLQGILMNTLYEMDIPYVVCATNTWRAFCGVKGRSRIDKKRSMQLLVKDWFNVSVTDDEADAIGIAKYVAEKHNKDLTLTMWE